MTPSGADSGVALDAIAKAIVDSNSYMTLGTAAADGLPWVSPVWYAPEEYQELFWVSSPEARHSRNLAVRPELSIVVFDSTVRMGTGQAVYRATVSEHWVLDPDLRPDQRRRLDLGQDAR